MLILRHGKKLCSSNWLGVVDVFEKEVLPLKFSRSHRSYLSWSWRGTGVLAGYLFICTLLIFIVESSVKKYHNVKWQEGFDKEYLCIYPSINSFLLPQNTKATIHFVLGIFYFFFNWRNLSVWSILFGKKKQQTQLGDINMPLVSPYFLAYRSNFNVKCCSLVLLLLKVSWTYSPLQEVYGYLLLTMEQINAFVF